MLNLFSKLVLGTALIATTSAFATDHRSDDRSDDQLKRVSCEIGGEIPKYTALEGRCFNGCKELDLTRGLTDRLVMQVVEHNNTALGYKVTLFSSNSGKLKNGSFFIPYTAKYNGVPVSLLSAGSIVTNQGAQLSPINVTKDLKISVAATPAASAMAGYYSDTVTFEIRAN